MSRIYLHGDEHESEPGTFYCRGCDSFAPLAHFLRDGHQRTNREYLQRGAQALAASMKKGLRCNRPARASTVFQQIDPLTAMNYRRFIGPRILGIPMGIRSAPEPPRAA